MESLLFLHQNAFFRRSVIDRKDEFLGEPMNFWENLGGYSSLCSEIRELRMIGLFQSWVRGMIHL